ncbi:gluconokinase [Nocardioides piscis]|uniref:Gluconokinase n=1 Tax=Nocardioides piscis TaxID=2714938 RepID=A0A6G7YFE6_9ACTN|nr:gluconokinase [Nocardioides piscis]QIK75542.1 gluconokinase [Nocardioides piscis]
MPAPLVVVTGLSGSGKTTVGASLARALDVPFCDADDLHPEANVAKMASGRALDDRDRLPWLELVGHWLADHAEGGGVTACSALKRSYRDLLRSHAPAVGFLHLSADADVLAERLASRSGHFMPPAMLRSQLETLEPLEPDEPGMVVDAGTGVADIVEKYVEASGRT